MIDVMLEKKPGVRNIHMLRIIGLVCPEFSTALSYFIGHLRQKNFEVTQPTEEQHGSSHNRQSIKAAMLTKTAQVRINIACNEIATATSRQELIHHGAHPPLPPLLSPPYKGSSTWITAHHKGRLYKARQSKPMEKYLKRKYNWNDCTLNDIHWPSIKTTR
jgi:hypothetical protein